MIFFFKQEKQPIERSSMEQGKKDGGKRTDWFVNARFGMFIHWGLYSIPARGEWVRNAESISNEAYQPYFNEFNPDHYDPKRWAALARAAGQKYAVLTAKHHDGFCLFDSALTDYKATNTPAGRDLVREYAEAMRAEGLKVGLYYSLIDWHHPHYPVAGDSLHPMRNSEAVKAEPRNFDLYLEYMHGQVRELLSNYGRIDIMWFDFSYGKMEGETWRAAELVRMIRSLQPHMIIDNRLTAGHVDSESGAGLGDFASPEQIIPAEGVVDRAGGPVPWEACITMNDNWGYSRTDHNWKSAGQIVRMLVECVSKNGNLLINVGPTARGEIPAASVERLEEVGKWMRANSAGIYGCGKAGLPKPEWGYYTRKGNTLYAHILNPPVGPVALPGLGNKVRRARLLADGSELSLSRPWMAGENTRDCFVTVGPKSCYDPIDTVIALDLA